MKRPPTNRRHWLAADLDGSGRLVVFNIAAVKLVYAVGMSLGRLVQSKRIPDQCVLAAAMLALSKLAFTASPGRNTHGDPR